MRLSFLAELYSSGELMVNELVIPSGFLVLELVIQGRIIISPVDSLSLKRPWPEIFNLWFFHQTTPSGPLIHELKPFCIWLCIRRDI
jgi:hypothetical protein